MSMRIQEACCFSHLIVTLMQCVQVMTHVEHAHGVYMIVTTIFLPVVGPSVGLYQLFSPYVGATS